MPPSPLLFGRRRLARLGVAAGSLTCLRGLAFAGTPTPGGTAAAAPPGEDPGLLVLVSLRGGMDGLHLLSPADDRDFADARPAALRTPAEGPEAGHRLDVLIGPHRVVRGECY